MVLTLSSLKTINAAPGWSIDINMWTTAGVDSHELLSGIYRWSQRVERTAWLMALFVYFQQPQLCGWYIVSVHCCELSFDFSGTPARVLFYDVCAFPAFSSAQQLPDVFGGCYAQLNDLFRRFFRRSVPDLRFIPCGRCKEKTLTSLL